MPRNKSISLDAQKKSACCSMRANNEVSLDAQKNSTRPYRLTNKTARAEQKENNRIAFQPTGISKRW